MSWHKFWINIKTNKFIEVPVGQHHQTVVMTDPFKFGITSKQWKKIADRNSSIPARNILWDELLFKMLWQRGWVRGLYDTREASLTLHNDTITADEYRKAMKVFQRVFTDPWLTSLQLGDDPRTSKFHDIIKGDTAIRAFASGRKINYQSPMAAFRESKKIISLKEYLNEVYKDSGLGKWFHSQSATKEPGWDRYGTNGKRLGKCGDAKDGEPYSACLSKQKADKLGKEGISSFVRRKRAAQEKAGRGDKGDGRSGKKPINVDTKVNEENIPTNPSLWKQAIQKAKSKFDVYPSAYANAWASKWYKSQGGGWKSETKESITMKSFKEYLSEGFKQQKHITNRDDMADHAQMYRKLVKNLKTKPGYEIVLTKTKEDPEYAAKTGLGDSSEIRIQPISGMPMGKVHVDKRGKREFASEVLAINEEKIPGGLGSRMSIPQIAKKHGVSVAKINQQIDKGTKVEMEHTNDRSLAREIAIDHVVELPDYYDRLAKIEEELTEDCGCNEVFESVTIREEGEKKDVTLNKPFRTSGGPKKFSVYVRNDKGNVVKVNFGDPNMEIKRDDPERRSSFRARHGCDKDPGPKWKAKYWSCKMWEKGKSVSDMTESRGFGI